MSDQPEKTNAPPGDPGLKSNGKRSPSTGKPASARLQDMFSDLQREPVIPGQAVQPSKPTVVRGPTPSVSKPAKPKQGPGRRVGNNGTSPPLDERIFWDTAPTIPTSPTTPVPERTQAPPPAPLPEPPLATRLTLNVEPSPVEPQPAAPTSISSPLSLPFVDRGSLALRTDGGNGSTAASHSTRCCQQWNRSHLIPGKACASAGRWLKRAGTMSHPCWPSGAA